MNASSLAEYVAFSKSLSYTESSMTKIVALKERKAGEARVAITPDSVKKFVALGCVVTIEKEAGLSAGYLDEDYSLAGALLADSAEPAAQDADIILCVNSPEDSLISKIPASTFVIGTLAPYEQKESLKAYAAAKLNAISMELLPRISRAQSMDVLSSQANLAGYRAVIEAVAEFGKVVPMMMTAAGTVPPAKALILGAGVAGLQAIATAKRLGAVVSAFDVRAAVKEQVQSLGASFVEVPADSTDSGETKGGYAKEMSEDYKKRQSQLIHDTLKKMDMVISTALIPGKKAPVLITKEMVEDMKIGSVIVDLAAASGGNCELTQEDKVALVGGVKIVGYGNMAARSAPDASALYARNLYNFISTLLLTKEGALEPKWEDELMKGTLLTKDGAIVHPQFSESQEAS